MGPISASASTSSSASSATQYGNVLMGDNTTSGLTNLPLILLGGFALLLIGGLVWIVSKKL